MINNKIFIFINKKYKFTYTKVPKAACTSILFSLLPTIEKAHIPGPPHHGIHNLYHDLFFHKKDYKLDKDTFIIDSIKKFQKFSELQSYFKFTCLRKPESRLLSGFFEKIICPKIDIAEYRPIKFVEPFVELYHKKKESISNVFDEFIKYLKSKEKTPWEIDDHFIPQWHLIRPDEIVYDKIFFTETITSEWSKVQEIFPMVNSLPKLNKRGRESSPLFEKQLLLDHKDDIQKIYSKDFEFMSRFR